MDFDVSRNDVYVFPFFEDIFNFFLKYTHKEGGSGGSSREREKDRKSLNISEGSTHIDEDDERISFSV